LSYTRGTPRLLPEIAAACEEGVKWWER